MRLVSVACGLLNCIITALIYRRLKILDSGLVENMRYVQLLFVHCVCACVCVCMCVCVCVCMCVCSCVLCMYAHMVLEYSNVSGIT